MPTFHALFPVIAPLAPQDGYELRWERLSDLSLSSGRIAAADPRTSGVFEAFTRIVPSGRWPVEVLLARDIRHGHTCVAAARVVFRDEPPARFELAVTAEYAARAAAKNEHDEPGYAVTSSAGCFADAEAPVPNGDALVTALEKKPGHTWSWAEASGLVAFSAGYGEGSYGSYFGLDAGSDAVCLLTHFEVLQLELPRRATDMALRQAEAERLLEQLTTELAQLDRTFPVDVAEVARFLTAALDEGTKVVPGFVLETFLQPSYRGRERPGRQIEAAEKLSELGAEGAVVVPRLLERLAATHDALERDILATALGGLLVGEEADAALMGAMPRLSDPALDALLRKRVRDRTAPAPSVIAAWLERWSTASLGVRAGILASLKEWGMKPLHPSFGALATDAARQVIASPASDDATRLTMALVAPYRTRSARGADGLNRPYVVAPAELVALLESLALHTPDPYKSTVLDTMIVQASRA